jgi:hypothetical protein
MYGNKKQKKQSKKYVMSACFPVVELPESPHWNETVTSELFHPF